MFLLNNKINFDAYIFISSFLKLMVICSLKIEMSFFFFGCRRGNPLHLCLERYRKLNQLWLHHCILEEIAQSLDVVNVMFAIEWQMF